jgi:hypothetical protein
VVLVTARRRGDDAAMEPAALIPTRVCRDSFHWGRARRRFGADAGSTTRARTSSTLLRLTDRHGDGSGSARRAYNRCRTEARRTAQVVPIWLWAGIFSMISLRLRKDKASWAGAARTTGAALQIIRVFAADVVASWRTADRASDYAVASARASRGQNRTMEAGHFATKARSLTRRR